MSDIAENQDRSSAPSKQKSAPPDMAVKPTLPEMKAAWEKMLTEIEKLVRPQYFQSFILTIRLLGTRGDELILGFPDRFYRDWVHDHYANLIQEKFDEASQNRFRLEYTVENKSAGVAATLAPMEPTHSRSRSVPLVESQSITPSRAAAQHKASKTGLPWNTQLNAKYGFETFVVGSSNQFAHAASFTVAEAPGRHYNPLFIYGDVGLGKTHLMNAIGLKIQEKFPALRIHYTTFERFTNHMIESVRYQKMEEFRERYRKNCDVLVIDDIQFISGKERTQEEFFHTFNTLTENGKQVVLSSDRHPKEIQGLEDRLRSRFEMGLTVDIQIPEMETRVAIVFKKAEVDGIPINHDVAYYLAKIYRSNIRELEGAMLKISAFASLTGSEINLELAQQVLKEDVNNIGESPLDPEEIMKLVARHFQVSFPDLKSERRNRQLAVPRMVAMFLCRRYAPHLSLPDIGNIFGGKNHTTVLHAVRRVEKLQNSDSMLKEHLIKLENLLKQSSR